MTVDLRFRDGVGVSADGVPISVATAAAVVAAGPVLTADLGEITQAAQLNGMDAVTVTLGAAPTPSYDLAVDLLVSSERATTIGGLLSGDALPVVIRAVPGTADGWVAEATVAGTAGGNAATVVVRSGLLTQPPGTFVLITLAVLGNEVVLLIDNVVVDRRRRSGFGLGTPAGQTVLVGAPASGFVGQVAAVRIKPVVPISIEALATAAIDAGVGAIASVWDEQPTVLGDAEGSEVQYGGIRVQRFSLASVYWSAGTDVHTVRGPIRDRYDALGAAFGRLGLPVAEEASLSELLRTPKDHFGRGLRLSDLVMETVSKRRMNPDDVIELGALPAQRRRVRNAGRAAGHFVGVGHGRGEGLGVGALTPHHIAVQEVAERLDLPVDELLANRGGHAEVFRQRFGQGRAHLDDAMVLAPDHFLATEPLAQALGVLEREGAIVGDLDPDLSVSVQDLLSAAGHLDKELRIVDRRGIGYVLRAPRAQRFERGIIVWSAGEGARELYSTVATYWLAMGGSDGMLGVPLTGESPVAGGTMVRFVGATVYSSPRTGTHEVHGDILVKYQSLGGPAGGLGFPVTDEQDLEGAPGARVSVFEHGDVLWSGATGAFFLIGAIRDFYRANGGAAKYGLPVTDETTIPGGEREIRYNDFERGLIAWNQHLGAFDSFELRLVRVNSGEISDGYEFPAGEDTEAELITRSWVTVDGTEVRNVRAPADGHAGRSVDLPNDPLQIPLHRNLNVEVRIKAWDWDAASADDELAEHRHTFTFDDAFFGYISTGGGYPEVASTWDSGDASSTAIKFSYEFGPHFPVDLTKFRQYLWWPFANFTTDELGWDEYADTFDDVDPDKDLLGEIGDALGVDYYSREYAEVAKGGNCFGMSLLAAETFNHRSGYADPLSDDLDNPLNRRAINLRQGVQKGVAYMMYRLASAALPKAFDPRNLWAQVGALTGAGTPVLVSMKGKQGDKSAGHAVVAYRCSEEGAEKWIWIADPNLPYSQDSDDKHSTIRIRPDGSYTVQFGGSSYDGMSGRPSFDATAYSAGSRGDRYLTWTPFGVLNRPHMTPSLGLEIACAALNLVLSSTGDGGEVHQIGTASGEQFFADRRREVWDRLRADEDRLRAAAGILGGPAHQEGPRFAEPVARAREALAAISLLTGDSGRGLSDTIATLPSQLLRPAQESWGGVGGLQLASEIGEADLLRPIEGIGHQVTPEAWPELVEVPIEGGDGGQLFAMSGTVPKDLFVEMSSRQHYDLRAYAAGSAARVKAPSGPAGTDTIRLDRFTSERPGIRVSSTLAVQRLVEVALSRAVSTTGREEVGWNVALDLAAEGEAELAWVVGRIGARLTRPGGAPAVHATWGGGRPGNKRTVVYQLPATVGAEQLSLQPVDLASPFGALQVDRLAALDGTLLERLELTPL